ncbi:LysR family transcriptional regulator [Streptomyces sp. NPDC050625]|uniref:LysR family transcriptional regulator n=1 Tax=Streptomyces sp. NPDC050625 TaxID=3154629 RepID=UPI00343A7E14
MELRHIRYFVAVAEECHFGRAAERLHIAQPPLSQQIKQLEAELGVPLLVRTTRKVELTPAGVRYLERARGILAAINAAGEEAGWVAAGLAGRVSIGFTGSATYELLPMLTRTLRQEMPGVELDLKGEMLTPSQVEALEDRSLDIGFLRPPVRDPKLEVMVFRREPLIAVLPEEHPLTGSGSVQLRELRDEPFICYPSHHRSVLHDAIYDACQRAGFRPSSVQEVGETATLVSFVAAGLGVALVPASVQHLTVTGAVYRPLAGTTEEVALAVAARTGDESPLVKRVLTRIRTLLGGGRPTSI